MDVIPDVNRFEYIYDKLEIMILLGYCYQGGSPRHLLPPRGLTLLLHGNNNSILDEVGTSISDLKINSPYVISRIFGETVEECEICLKKVR